MSKTPLAVDPNMYTRVTNHLVNRIQSRVQGNLEDQPWYGFLLRTLNDNNVRQNEYFECNSDDEVDYCSWNAPPDTMTHFDHLTDKLKYVMLQYEYLIATDIHKATKEPDTVTHYKIDHGNDTIVTVVRKRFDISENYMYNCAKMIGCTYILTNTGTDTFGLYTRYDGTRLVDQKTRDYIKADMHFVENVDLNVFFGPMSDVDIYEMTGMLPKFLCSRLHENYFPVHMSLERTRENKMNRGNIGFTVVIARSRIAKYTVEHFIETYSKDSSKVHNFDGGLYYLLWNIYRMRTLILSSKEEKDLSDIKEFTLKTLSTVEHKTGETRRFPGDISQEVNSMLNESLVEVGDVLVEMITGGDVEDMTDDSSLAGRDDIEDVLDEFSSFKLGDG
jgi:hypothetical protein